MKSQATLRTPAQLRAAELIPPEQVPALEAVAARYAVALPPDLALHVRNVTGLSNLARPEPAVAGILLQFNLALCVVMLAPVGPPPGYKVCGPDPDRKNFEQCVTAARIAAGNGQVLNYDFFASDHLAYLDIRLIGQPCPGDPPPPE